MQINSVLCDKVLRYLSLKPLNADKQIEGHFFLCSPNHLKMTFKGASRDLWVKMPTMDLKIPGLSLVWDLSFLFPFLSYRLSTVCKKGLKYSQNTSCSPLIHKPHCQN